MSEPVPLKRSLGLFVTTLYGLGNILGAGIYVLVGKVAGSAGLFTPVAFIVASLVAAWTALTYAELSARMPLSAGESVYVQTAMGRRWLSLAVGLMIALAGMISAATITRGFVGYLEVFFVLHDPYVITVVVMALGLVAAWGISQSAWLAALITLVELAGLLLIIGVGSPSLVELPARLPELVPPLEFAAWQGILLGAFLAFYAYIGFEDMVNVAEEVKRPQRTMPLAILLALLISTVLYILVALVATLSLDAQVLEASDAPLALIYEQATGESPVIITQIALFAVLNGALIQIIMAARLLYGMSRQGWLPAWLGRVHVRTRTPLVATALVTAVVLSLALWLPLVMLAKLTSFIVLIVFALVNAALVIIKRREPAPPGVWVVSAWIPRVGLLCCVGLTLFQIMVYLLPDQ